MRLLFSCVKNICIYFNREISCMVKRLDKIGFIIQKLNAKTQLQKLM